MWDGYLTEKFMEYCKQNDLVIERIHTSGHATVKDLKAFASAVNPKAVIPIHTFEGHRYPQLFKNVKVLGDRETITLS
jgi:ribonuclease J